MNKFFKDFDKYYIGIVTADGRNTAFVAGIKIVVLITTIVLKATTCMSSENQMTVRITLPALNLM